ncbi:Triple QxxK/R motif-containing protein [Aix galericulata]|nr:Triple QxxK/R motif-containing protein [Aix galericulata]
MFRLVPLRPRVGTVADEVVHAFSYGSKIAACFNSLRSDDDREILLPRLCLQQDPPGTRLDHWRTSEKKAKPDGSVVVVLTGKQDYKKTRPMLRATRLKAEAKKTALGVKEVALVLAAILVDAKPEP